MRRIKRISFFISLLAFLSLAPFTYLRGSVDIILMIDNSGSMEENDPSDWRLKAANIIITYAHRDDRVAVILFSDDPENVNEMTGLSPLTPLSEDVKEKLRERISEFTANGNTDIILALKLAQKALQRRYQKRRSLIFLLTDGEMHPPKGRYPDEEWNKYLSPVLSWYSDKELPIHGIALTAKADSPFLRNISNQTGGGYRKINDAREIVDFYLEQYRALTDEVVKSAQEGRVSFEITGEQQLQEVTFALLTEGGGREVISLTRDGENMLGKAYRSETSWARPQIGSFTVLRCPGPKVGLWRLLTRGKGEMKAWVISRLLPSSPYKHIVVKEIKKEYAAGEKIPIEVAFVDGNGAPIKDSSFLEEVEGVEAVVTCLETNEKEEIGLKGPDRNGVFTGSFIPKRPGGYTIETKEKLKGLGERKTPQQTIHVKEFKLQVTPSIFRSELKPGESEKVINFTLIALSQKGTQIPSPVTVESPDLKKDGKVIIPRSFIRIEPPQLTVTTGSPSSGRVIIEIPRGVIETCEGILRFSAPHAVSAEMRIKLLAATPSIISLKSEKDSIFLYEPLEIKAIMDQPCSIPQITIDVLYPDGRRGSTILTRQTDTIYAGVFREASQTGEITFTPGKSEVYKGGSSLKVKVKPPIFKLSVSKLKRLKAGETQEFTVTLKGEKLYHQKSCVVKLKPDERYKGFLSLDPSMRSVTLVPDEGGKATVSFPVRIIALRKLPWFSGCKLSVSIEDPEEITVKVKGRIPWYIWIVPAVGLILAAWVIWISAVSPRFRDEKLIRLSQVGDIEIESFILKDIAKMGILLRRVTIGSERDSINIGKGEKVAEVTPWYGGCYLKLLKERKKEELYDGLIVNIEGERFKFQER